MKVVDAWWDSRNLGIECVELDFDESDGAPDALELDEAVSSYAYAVARVPSSRPDLLLALQRYGFEFIECQIELRHDLQEVEAVGLLERILPQLRSIECDEEACERVFTEIERGLFDSDRIYLDDRFDKAIAARRYVNWIKDERVQGSQLYEVEYKGDPIGFYSMKRVGENVAYPFLAGLYKGKTMVGFGGTVILEPLLKAKELGCAKMDTFVSSNNLPMLKIHEMLGFKVRNIIYVLIMHR